MAGNVLASNKQSLKQPIFSEESSYAYVTANAQSDNPYTLGHWSQNLLIRLMIGVIVTAAVTLLLVRIAELVLFWFTPVAPFWKTFGGFLLWQGLEIVGVFIGAMLCVAGRAEMMTMGMLLGLLVGCLSLALLPTNPSVSPTLYFAMPGWFLVFSCMGAWLGELLWHPQFRQNTRVVSTAKLTQGEDEISITQLIRKAILGLVFANIRWLKVILAVLIIIVTLRYTHDALSWFIVKTGLSTWIAEVGMQKSWVETMIKMIVIILCGTMVGAGTTHGIAHGFWIGVICGVIDLLLHVIVPRETVLEVNEILWEIGWVFLLCIASGGFGAQVIPPIMFLAQRRRPASLR